MLGPCSACAAGRPPSHQVRAGSPLTGVPPVVHCTLHHSALLAGHGPSGSPGPSRRRGCSHSPYHLPGQAVPSFNRAAATAQRWGLSSHPVTWRLVAHALVGVDLDGSGAPPPSLRTDRRNVLHDRLEHGGVVDVGGGHHRGQRQPATVADQMELASRLATIDRICAHMVPHAWPAHSWCPRSPTTSPAGRARRGGPRPEGGADRTRRRWPTR